MQAGFVERKNKQLIPTKDGKNLVAVLPDILTSPKLTAEWENALTETSRQKQSLRHSNAPDFPP